MRNGIRMLLILLTGSPLLAGCFIGGAPGASETKVVSCVTKQFAVPDFAKRLLYDGNGLPKQYTYAKKVAADAPYLGTYTRAYRGANLDTKKVKLAPFQGTQASHPPVYVDKSPTCNYIYLGISHGMFSLAVYKKGK